MSEFLFIFCHGDHTGFEYVPLGFQNELVCIGHNRGDCPPSASPWVDNHKMVIPP